MNINRVCFAGNHTAEPEVNYSPNGTAVVSASIANNVATLCASFRSPNDPMVQADRRPLKEGADLKFKKKDSASPRGTVGK